MRLDTEGIRQLIREGCEVLVTVNGVGVDLTPYVNVPYGFVEADEGEGVVRFRHPDDAMHGLVGAVKIRVIRPLRVGASDGVSTADGT